METQHEYEERELEDRLDAIAACKALEDPERIPFEDVRKELGMESYHNYEEREAEEWRRQELHEEEQRFLPRDKASRTVDEILADVRKQCSEDVEASQITYAMCGYLAKQVEILERGMDNLRQLNNDLEAERCD